MGKIRKGSRRGRRRGQWNKREGKAIRRVTGKGLDKDLWESRMGEIGGKGRGSGRVTGTGP